MKTQTMCRLSTDGQWVVSVIAAVGKRWSSSFEYGEVKLSDDIEESQVFTLEESQQAVNLMKLGIGWGPKIKRHDFKVEKQLDLLAV